jgi:hypothetical protein
MALRGEKWCFAATSPGPHGSRQDGKERCGCPRAGIDKLLPSESGIEQEQEE